MKESNILTSDQPYFVYKRPCISRNHPFATLLNSIKIAVKFKSLIKASEHQIFGYFGHSIVMVKDDVISPQCEGLCNWLMSSSFWMTKQSLRLINSR